MCSLRSIGGRNWEYDLGCTWSDSEIPLFVHVYANLSGKNGRKQYLVGSLSGALSS